MFLNYKVLIPDSPGKIVRKNRSGNTYIEYEYDRSYDAAKQYTYPKRASIGRVDPSAPTMMTPNENYLIMVKGMKEFIQEIILKYKGKFENKRAKYIEQYDVYGTQTDRPLFGDESRRRHVHIYYSDARAFSEKSEIKQMIRRLKAYLEAFQGKECTFGGEIQKYFYLHYEEDGKTFKIEQAQAKVAQTREAHDKAVDEYKRLLDIQKERQKETLLKALESSPRSFDEILAFITSPTVSPEEE